MSKRWAASRRVIIGSTIVSAAGAASGGGLGGVALAAGSPSGDDRTLGVVDFSIFPHLAPDGMPGNSIAEAEHWAVGIASPGYAIDDQTAITVVDGTVEVVSEGEWRLFS